MLYYSYRPAFTTGAKGSCQPTNRCYVVIGAVSKLPVVLPKENWNKNMIFAHSPKDGYLVLIALSNLTLLVFATCSFGVVPLVLSLIMIALLCFAVCTNYQTVAHNFLHNPFFRSPLLNKLFSIINTMILGVSQTLYREHHMHHHKYNNDRQDPATGTTLDRTSTWRYSKSPDHEENIFSYAFIGFFKQDFMFFVNSAKKKNTHSQVYLETTLWLLFVTLLAFINWRGTLFVFLPAWYLGQCAALFENYLEHHGSIPGNRQTDSVSCYGTFYNWLWFNNGYHQEHHYRPQIHWTKIPNVQAELPPPSHRRICKGAHWFNINPPPLESYPLELGVVPTKNSPKNKVKSQLTE